MKEVTIKKALSLLSLLCLCSFRIFSQNEGDDVVIGKYHVINSKILEEQRRILVHLPEGYESTELKYPVVYHLYGDFVMTYFADAATITERLHDSRLIPQVILIGVDNTDRYRDLRPVKPNGSPGGSEKFIQYLTEELIPYVDTNFRTAGFKILVGPQAGACFGLFALMEHTDLFDAFILENSFDNPPTVDDYLLSKARSFFKSDKSVNKFLFMNCTNTSANLQVALEQKTIIESNIPKNFRFDFKLTDSEDDLIPSTDLKYGLKTLFSGYQLPKDIIIGRLDDIKKYYQILSEKLGYPVNISDRILTEAGERLREDGNNEEVKRILEYTLELYPKSLDGLFRLAQMNVSEGKFEKAKELYVEFLKIRPQEAIVQNKLKSVEKIINESASYEIELCILSDGLKKGLEVYQYLKKDNPDNKYFDENEFNAMGYRFLNSNKINEAIAAFEMSVEMYPNSSNAWDSLAEAYMKIGDKERAIRNYKKSLKLNPDNDNAKKMMEQLLKK